MDRRPSMKYAIVFTVVATTALIAPMALAQDGPADNMSFFLTSVGRGDGANLGGLAGADVATTVKTIAYFMLGLRSGSVSGRLQSQILNHKV